MKEQLPPHIVQRLEPFHHTANGDYSEIDNQELAVPVSFIRWEYPCDGMRVHKSYEPLTNLHDLLREIRLYLGYDYDDGLCIAPHSFNDYYTEVIEIHPNNAATVYFGS